MTINGDIIILLLNWTSRSRIKRNWSGWQEIRREDRYIENHIESVINEHIFCTIGNYSCSRDEIGTLNVWKVLKPLF